MLYGVSYYDEYQPYARLDQDIRLMREAGLSFVRIGDSIWSLCEPEDGHFEFAWLQRVLDALHAAELKVVLVTPTYAIPPWLHRLHPEIMAQYAHDQRAYYGGRQNMDFTHPTYRYYAERMIRQLLEAVARHPALIGFQVDNETGSGMLHNPSVFAHFVAYLKDKFGSVDRLNEIWGLTYWSHRLGDWSDLWTPDGNTTPGYDLEWRRFQAAITTEFLAWQAGIVREYAHPEQFITQDVVGGHGRPNADRHAIAQVVDILAENPYHATQDGLLLPSSGTRQAAPEWMTESGVWALYLKGDLGRSGRQANFLVTEMNALSIGGPAANYPAYDGQWRLAVYTYISRGANALAYWHWHTLHYGAETYWGGVLNHDLEPGRCYREVSRIGHELQQHGGLLTDLQVDADVGFLYSQDSKYGLEFQPCLTLPGQPDPDPSSYQRIFDTFYRAFFDARAQTAIVHPAQDIGRFRVLVVPALYVADDALLERLITYASDGGHLLLTFRGGYADEFARARWQRAPGVLRSAVGAGYSEYSNLTAALSVRSSLGGFPIPATARAETWADGLELEGATPLAYYDHPHFGRFPAIVSQAVGRGRITYCGTLPNAPLGQALAAWVLTQAGVQAPIADVPESVRVSTARARDGRRLWFFSNWSWAERTVTPLPVSGRELFSDSAITQGGAVTLGPWDVQIVVEH